MPNTIEAITPVSEAITSKLEEHGASQSAIFACSLALEELVTNIIKYGYDDDQEHQIDIELRVGDTDFELQITDDGHEFDPFQAPEPDINAPLEERSIGGLGLYFVRNLMDRYQYSRLDGKNIVMVAKTLSETGQG